MGDLGSRDLLYDFDKQLAFSKGVIAATCEQTIMAMIDGCVQVEKTDVDVDRTGVDYTATLRRGSVVRIDHKARAPGAAKFWNGEPDIALEIWSVLPDGRKGVAGWTLDERKATEYTLHTYDPSDSTDAYLFPFQLLRIAFRRELKDWMSIYQTAIQSSGKWRSQCMFVPASKVIAAMERAMQLSAQHNPAP